ncbi:hypothetical protein BCU31_025250 [Vibrio lentus]|uniref:hypothetical protein n=1 Tax=Vibrio lentus TaxID=136468 RepID=UPI0039A71004
MPKPPTTKASHRAFTLSKEEQQPLLDLQQAKFDSKEEMLNEASQMKEAMQSDTVQAMVESKAQDNHEYQEQAQRNIEEQAISPEIEMEAGDMVE